MHNEINKIEITYWSNSLKENQVKNGESIILYALIKIVIEEIFEKKIE